LLSQRDATSRYPGAPSGALDPRGGVHEQGCATVPADAGVPKLDALLGERCVGPPRSMTPKGPARLRQSNAGAPLEVPRRSGGAQQVDEALSLLIAGRGPVAAEVSTQLPGAP
jgi:hypothetical protein